MIVLPLCHCLVCNDKDNDHENDHDTLLPLVRPISPYPRKLRIDEDIILDPPF